MDLIGETSFRWGDAISESQSGLADAIYHDSYPKALIDLNIEFMQDFVWNCLTHLIDWFINDLIN